MLIFDGILIEKIIFNNVEIDKINFNGVPIFEKMQKINYTPKLIQKIVSPYGTSESVEIEAPQTGGKYEVDSITVEGSVPISNLSLNENTRNLSFAVSSCNKGLLSTINVPVVNCDNYFDYTIPVEIQSCTHPNMTYVSGSSASCTSSGTAAHYKCTCSNKTLNSSGNIMSTYIAPLGHSFTQDKIWSKDRQFRSAATCTSYATYWRECDRCTVHSSTQWFSDVSGGYAAHNYNSSGICTVCNGKYPVKITSHPSSITVPEGTTVSFSVSATGMALSYKWQYMRNGGSSWHDSTASGCTTSSITFPAINRNGYKYRCVVTSANGLSATSSAATLSTT